MTMSSNFLSEIETKMGTECSEKDLSTYAAFRPETIEPDRDKYKFCKQNKTVVKSCALSVQNLNANTERHFVQKV